MAFAPDAGAGACRPRARLALLAWACACLLAFISEPAPAQIEVGGLVERHPEIAQALQRRLPKGSFIAIGEQRGGLPSSGLARLSANLVALPSSQLGGALFADRGLAARQWSAPRRLLLDRTTHWVRRDAYVAQLEALGQSNSTGQGVLIGVVDSGLDFEHPDLRNPDGTTRVAWFLDFASEPLGIHPELEEEYGCQVDEEFACAVLSGREIDSLLEGNTLLGPSGRRVRLATDHLGHGTHVASTAAGNGSVEGRYTGIAPEAGLIIARVASTESSVSDAGVLMATRFVFERADELGMPVVVNLSLGGDFGPHDGTSAISRALAEFVQEPGRALVVAGGNSGMLYRSSSVSYVEPLGIHTEVVVPSASTARVPLLFPNLEVALEGSVLIWVGGQAGDELWVGVEDARGDEFVPPVPPGRAALVERGGIEVIVINKVDTDELPQAEDLRRGAAVLLSGEFDPGKVLALRLQGNGTANIWLQSEGQLNPAFGSRGVVVPAASRARTITIPAEAPELIAVGATVNRTSWPSRADGEVQLTDFGTPLALTEDSPAFFSSDGPNDRGWPKPDVLAPGVALVAAMSAASDPNQSGSLNPFSIFSASGICEASLECAVVSDAYAVTLGTSMSAPVVSGAVALLLEQDPALTQAELLALLHAGSRRSSSMDAAGAQAEPGGLDLGASVRSLAMARGELRGAAPSAQRSWLAVSDVLARPDPAWRMHYRLHLRDAHGQLADADPEEVEIEVENGELLEPLSHPTPGLVQATLSASAGSAGKSLRVRFSHAGVLLAERDVPIGLDPHVHARGLSLRGGCALNHAAYPSQWPFLTALLLAIGARRRREGRCAS